MTTSNVKITASVIEPLLTQALTNRTVARMNNGETFESIEISVSDDFIDYVCSLGGLDPLSLGADRKNGINRQIIYAERALRRKGVCRKCGRGKYGLAVAPTTGVTVEPTVEPQAQPVSEPVVNEPTVEPPVLAKVTDGLLYERPSSFPSVGVFSDEHFRNIAIAQSKCFGRWSGSTRSACATCPLAQFCFEKQNLDLEAFATLYKERSAQPKPSESADKPSATTAKPSATRVGMGRKAKVDLTRAKRVKAQISAQCTHCKKEIASGSDTIWVPELGIFHSHCVEQ